MLFPNTLIPIRRASYTTISRKLLSTLCVPRGLAAGETTFSCRGMVGYAWRPACEGRGSAMHLVELLLPLHDNSGQPFRAEKYAEVRQHLTERFGGLTAFT